MVNAVSNGLMTPPKTPEEIAAANIKKEKDLRERLLKDKAARDQKKLLKKENDKANTKHDHQYYLEQVQQKLAESRARNVGIKLL